MLIISETSRVSDYLCDDYPRQPSPLFKGYTPGKVVPISDYQILSLNISSGDFAKSDSLVDSCLDRVEDIESKVRMLRLRSKNHWMRGNYKAALADTLAGLHLLGVDVNSAPSRREADIMFEQVKNEILAVGFDEILSIPRARDSRTDLAIALLNDAGELFV